MMNAPFWMKPCSLTLNIEINTQGLKKWGWENETSPFRGQPKTNETVDRSVTALTHLQQENLILKEQLSTTSNIHYSESARLNMWIHCSMSRIHQILIGIISRIRMTPNEHNEISQLTYELLRVAQQVVPQPHVNQVD